MPKRVSRTTNLKDEMAKISKIDNTSRISELPTIIWSYAGVGQACLTWQPIEHFIDRRIWKWAGLSKRKGMCITAHMGFPLKCDVFKSLAHNKFNSTVYDKALSKFIETRLKPAKAVRDRFAHALIKQDPIAYALEAPFAILEKPSRLSPNQEVNTISHKELALGLMKILDAKNGTFVHAFLYGKRETR